MPSDLLRDIPADVRGRAARIRLAAFDVDGTLNDGTLWYPGDGPEIKCFHVQDGLGLKLLREHGIEVAIVTARESRGVEVRARELGLRHVQQGTRSKRDALEGLARALQLPLEQCSFMGDDLPDLPALQVAGLAVAPANAHPWVAARVHWCTRRGGGGGAGRELCDLLLAAQGHADAVLRRFLPE